MLKEKLCQTKKLHEGHRDFGLLINGKEG